ncbi:MAG: sigma-70 family RNA polymerase sigma factor [Candidatus Cloacimonetes bacterium]|nr:sigma-70 family RNA polymerase sigma factor [Candidatus Cloacimonadota bacterium]
MELNDSYVQDHFQKAYSFALYKLGNKQQAEDIASQTINLFLLKSDMINPEKTESWVRGTCLNFCRKYFTNVDRERTTLNYVRDELISFYDVDHTEDNELLTNFRKAMESLNELEARSLVLYFNSGQNIKRMSEIIGENHASLRKRISRIKQKLKAETYKELGYIATKKIIVPQMHEAIIQFVKRLKTNIENNTIEKMFYYFSEANIKDYKPQYDIQKIRDYEVVLRDGKYTIYLFYQDSENKMSNIFFTFYLNSKNQLKITKLPKQGTKMICLKAGTVSAQEIIKYLKENPENHQGLIKMSPEMIKRIIAKG